MTVEQISPRLNHVLETDVFGPAGFKPIADFFSHKQKILLESAAQGNRDSQIATRLLGMFYPDVFPALTKAEPLTLVDPREDINHSLCGLALDVQKLFKGSVFPLSPADYPSVIILADKKKQCGYLPIFIDEYSKIDQIFFAGQILPTIHEPVKVTITGLHKQDGQKCVGFYEFAPNWVRYPDIQEKRFPLLYLQGSFPHDLSLAMVNALRRGESQLSPSWSKLTLFCPPIEKTWPAKRDAISDWSYQKLLNSISLISTQRTLKFAQSLSGDLSENTLMMFLANHAQVIITKFANTTS